MYIIIDKANFHIFLYKLIDLNALYIKVVCKVCVKKCNIFLFGTSSSTVM